MVAAVLLKSALLKPGVGKQTDCGPVGWFWVSTSQYIFWYLILSLRLYCVWGAASLKWVLFTELMICKLPSLHAESISQFIPQNIFIWIFQRGNWPIVATLAGNAKLSNEEWSSFNLYKARHKQYFMLYVIASFQLHSCINYKLCNEQMLIFHPESLRMKEMKVAFLFAQLGVPHNQNRGPAFSATILLIVV